MNSQRYPAEVKDEAARQVKSRVTKISRPASILLP